jgi:hypothetical protein
VVFDPDARLRRWRMNDPLMRRKFLVGIVCAAVGLFSAGTLLAAPKTYKYKCMKCKLIQEYGQPGVKKCPNDGQTMVRQN